MLIRAEQPSDWDAVRVVNVSAFETPLEANLVDALRSQAKPCVSLSVRAPWQVGHTNGLGVPGSSPSMARRALGIMGLAPMAVSPAHQRKGIGSALVRAGLEQCRQLGFGAVVVLGHPAYYPRFGFLPSTGFGIACEYEVAEDVFMVMELDAGFLRGSYGTIKYHAAFSEEQP